MEIKMRTKIVNIVSPKRVIVEEEGLTITDTRVLIEICGCGICMYEKYHYEGKLGKFPQKIGHEASGTVVEVGNKVQGFKKGDRVTGFICPAFSTYAIAEPKDLVKVPDEVNLEYALGEPLACAINVLRAANPEFMDTTAVVGCGFMGLLVISGLSKISSTPVIAIDVQDNRLEMAKLCGAKVLINSKRDNVEEKVKEITDSRMLNIAIEFAGIPATLEIASKILKSGRAKLILAGYHGTPSTYDLSNFAKGMVIINAHPGYSLNNYEDLRRGIKALTDGLFPMDKLITHRFKLDDIQKGLDIAYSGKDEKYIKGIVLGDI